MRNHVAPVFLARAALTRNMAERGLLQVAVSVYVVLRATTVTSQPRRIRFSLDARFSGSSWQRASVPEELTRYVSPYTLLA